jgi:hypothetical protein
MSGMVKAHEAVTFRVGGQIHTNAGGGIEPALLS